MKEIGSEFWLNQNNSLHKKASFNRLINFGTDQKLLYSGRTAIDYVLEDIDRQVKHVYMPSYCCDSMLQPFLERKIEIEFYEVQLNEEGITYNIDYTKKTDIFFAISYFGYSNNTMDYEIETFKKKNVIVIEDITHRLLNINNHCERADYMIASLRKWFAIPSGGLAVKQNTYFKNIELSSPPTSVVHNKIKAMTRKSSYINDSSACKNDDLNKKEFLSLFSDFNNSLSTDYELYKIDEKSREIFNELDIEFIKERRLENARYIYENSHYFGNGIKFLFDNPDFENDCYLFIPLLIKESQRDSLRKHLISNSIFCPVHWPVPASVCKDISNKEIYSKELSLICDQRYQKTDMDKMLKKIGEFSQKL